MIVLIILARGLRLGAQHTQTLSIVTHVFTETEMHFCSKSLGSSALPRTVWRPQGEDGTTLHLETKFTGRGNRRVWPGKVCKENILFQRVLCSLLLCFAFGLCVMRQCLSCSLAGAQRVSVSTVPAAERGGSGQGRCFTT